MCDFLHHGKRGYIVLILLILTSSLYSSIVYAGGGGGGSDPAPDTPCTSEPKAEIFYTFNIGNYTVKTRTKYMDVDSSSGGGTQNALVANRFSHEGLQYIGIESSVSGSADECVLSTSTSSGAIAANKVIDYLQATGTINVNWDNNKAHCNGYLAESYSLTGEHYSDTLSRCCGDDSFDLGNGENNDLICIGPVLGETESYTWKAGLTSGSGGPYSITYGLNNYEVLFDGTDWFACDIETSEFNNFKKGSKSTTEISREDYLRKMCEQYGGSLDGSDVCTGFLSISGTISATELALSAGQLFCENAEGIYRTAPTTVYSGENGCRIPISFSGQTVCSLDGNILHKECRNVPSSNILTDNTLNRFACEAASKHYYWDDSVNKCYDNEFYHRNESDIISSMLGTDYMCFNGDTYEISATDLSAIDVDGNVDNWKECDVVGESVVVYNYTTDAYQIYYCDNKGKWVYDLDYEISTFPIRSSTCNAASIKLSTDSNTKIVDFAATRTKCCGDDFIENDDMSLTNYEFYNEPIGDRDMLLNYASGCWANRKIDHGKFIEDILTNTYLLNNFETSNDLTFWIPSSNEISTEVTGICLDKIYIPSYTNIVTNYSTFLTAGISYTLSYVVDDYTPSANTNFYVKIYRGTSEVYNEDISFNSDGTLSISSFDYTPSLSDVYRFEIGTMAGSICLDKIDLKPVEKKLLNYRGEFVTCGDDLNINLNDGINGDFSVINDPYCSVYDVEDDSVTRNNYYCDVDGFFTDNKELKTGVVTKKPGIDPIERTNYGLSRNLFTNSGFELSISGEQIGTCYVVDEYDITGFDHVKTTEIEFGGFAGNDYSASWLNFLNCAGSTQESEFVIDNLESGNYILSYWVNGNLQVSVSGDGVNEVETYSKSDWNREFLTFSFDSTQTIDITIKFSGVSNLDGYIDEIQLEKAATIPAVQVLPSAYNYVERRDGCCVEGSCWSGSYCQFSPGLTDNPNSIFEGTYGYICNGDDWSYVKKKFDWTDNYYNVGFCSGESQCYVDTADDGSVNCIDSGEWYSDDQIYAYYCDEGEWTSRTKYVATSLIKYAEDNSNGDYTLLCGNYQDVLNEFDYSVEYTPSVARTVEELIVGYTGSDYVCTPGYSKFPYELSYFDRPYCVNNLCVLTYNDGTSNNVVIGGSLNQKINPPNSYGFVAALGEDSFYCDNNEITTNELNMDSGFQRCSNGLFSGNRLWYDPAKMLFIYSANNLAGDRLDYSFFPGDSNTESIYSYALELFNNPISNIVESILSRSEQPGPVGFDGSIIPENYEIMKRTKRFNNLYVHNDDIRNIFAIKDVSFHHAGEGEAGFLNHPYELMIYQFTDKIMKFNNLEICKTFDQYERSNHGVVGGTNCTLSTKCNIYNGDSCGDEDNQYLLTSKRNIDPLDETYRSSEVWDDFTAKLRFN